MTPSHSDQSPSSGDQEPAQPISPLASNQSLQQDFWHWLALSTTCEQRSWLEAHPELLGVQAEALLHSESQPEGSARERLLHEARTRGGSAQAIREAYVNAYGGLVLDVPPWLTAVEQELGPLRDSRRPYETADRRTQLLQAAVSRAKDDATVAPETLATLQHEFAMACLERSGSDRSQPIEAAISACAAALKIYRRRRYPSQYAAVRITLGNAYRERIVGTPRANRERAILCYRRALQVSTLADEPVKYAQAQLGLGQVYQLRIAGTPQDNLEQAIACCLLALQVYRVEEWPFEHAQTLLTLGSALLQRIGGERRDNLEQAITYYRQAAEIFTPEATPVKYALSQHALATAFSQRIGGERRDNLEQALAYYHRSLRIYTVEAFPIEYARVQNNLGIVYWQRTAGERSDNLEQAIACYRQAEQIFSLDAFPYQNAMLQNNLGATYVVRVEGRRRDNLEQAIACYQTVLQVWTLEAFPLQHGKVQNNLGEVYQLRLAGERSDNLERAIAYYHEALRIFTPKTFPIEHAMTQQNLGAVYKSRLAGEREENLRSELACYHNALDIYTLNAFPSEHRQLQLDCAEALALRQEWAAVHEAYAQAHKAEDLLVALSTGAVGLDVILKEGRDATVRDGFALIRLGRVEEAAITIEHGRARGLFQALEIDTADPTSIRNLERRTRYTVAHQAFIEAQATLHAPLPPTLDENSQRQLTLERTARYREAKTAFDTIIEEIRIAQDPANFLARALDATTILQIVDGCGPGHALVYLAATPWGGIAVAALPDSTQSQGCSRFAALDFPSLTDALVNGLVETRLDDDSDDVAGGFYCAQSGNTFELLQAFAGQTFREKASTLHEKCLAQDNKGTLDAAAQAVLSLPTLAFLVDCPLSSLSDRDCSLLSETLCHTVLQLELQRCQALLSESVIEPLATWLRALAVSHLTIIPCGPLALLPLGGILLQNGQQLSESLPISMAPSIRALQQDERHIRAREGIYALGNPYPTRQELRWSEAEALTLALLGNQIGQSEGVKVQWQATRSWLIEVLRQGYVVDASCHGIFDTHDFLRSRLLLADAETLTLADMLSHQADLRGLRLFILSACQTAIIDPQGARDEIRSLAAGMLQAGAAAVLATLWAVDDRATYILMVRFAQEWFPHLYDEPPAMALAKAQHWLRTVTNRELQNWQTIVGLPTQASQEARTEQAEPPKHLVVVRGRGQRFDAAQAQELVQDRAELQDAPDLTPYADPYYWAGFQIIGW